jgi:glycosyltransferase involved in cell wall biosynthesis
VRENKKMVSVVINNYNYEEYIDKSICSALSQTFSPVEVIVVDDGSTDESWGKIITYGDKIHAIAKVNGGQGSAINAGYAVARGDWVLFLDADDLLDPNAIETMMDQSLDGVAKIQYKLQVVNSTGAPVGFCLPNRKMGQFPPDRMVANVGYYVSPPSSGNMYARGFLETVLPMDEGRWKISADAYLILSAPFHGQILSMEAILGSYRRHGQGASDLDPTDLKNMAQYVSKEMAKETNRLAWATEQGRRHYAENGWRGLKGISPTLAKYLVLDDVLNAVGVRQRFNNLAKIMKSIVYWRDYTLLQRLRFFIWSCACYVLKRNTALALVKTTLHPHLRATRS